MATKTPLQLLLEPAEYPCHATLADQAGEPVRVEGTLALAGDRPPVLSLHGDVPADMTISPDGGEGSMRFPQVSQLATLAVDLVVGLDAVLVDCTVTKLFPGRARVDAAAALVGPPGLAADPDSLVGATLQISGLDAALGEAPLREFRVPLRRDPDVPAEWTVIENQASRALDSADADAEAGAYWHAAYSAGNRYQQRVLFSPVATLALTSPVGLRELIDRWVTPLNRIVGLATGRRETITYLAVKTEPDQQRGLQVFGSGITQQPYASDESEVMRVEPAFRLFGGRAEEPNPTMLQLVRAWQQAEVEHNPLLETFAAFLLLPPQHPRPRYLLLVQALEGLHDHLNAAANAAAQAAWTKRREAAVAAVTASSDLDPTTVKFVRDKLPKRPRSGLSQTLQAVLRLLPSDATVEQVEALDLVQQVKADPTTMDKTWATALSIVRNDLSHGSRGWDSTLLQPAADLLETYCRAHLMLMLGVSSDLVAAFLARPST